MGRHVTLRAKITVLGLSAALIPLFSTAIVSFLAFRRVHLAQFSQQLDAAAAVKQRQLGFLANERLAHFPRLPGVQRLAALLADGQADDLAEISSLLAAIRDAVPGVEEAYAADMNGLIAASTSPGRRGERAWPEDLAPLELGRTALDFDDRMSRLRIRGPLTHQDKRIGVLILSGGAEQLTAIMADEATPVPCEVILARRTRAGYASTAVVPRPLLDALFRSGGQPADDKAAALVATRFIAAARWGLVVRPLGDAATAPLRRRAVAYACGVSLLSLLAIGLVVALNRTVGGSLARTRHLVENLRQGECRERLAAAGDDELGALVVALNELANDTLEKRRQTDRRLAASAAAATEAKVEQERLAKAGEESVEQFRRIVQDAPFPVLVHADDGAIKLASRVWTRTTGYELADLPSIGAMAETVLGGKGEGFVETVNGLFGAEEPAKIGELQVTTKDGETRHWAWSAAPLGATSEGQQLAVSMAMDVTERKLAEEALMMSHDKLEAWVHERTSELSRAKELLEAEILERRWAEEELLRNAEHLRIFVEHTPAAVAMFDKDMRYTLVSRKWLSDNGVEGQSVIGRSYYDVAPETPEAMRALHARCLAGSVERREAEKVQRPDGEQDWVRWEMRPWHDNQGEVAGVIMFSEVITAQKHAEEQLGQKARDLARSNAELQQFAYISSHDLQEPLRMVTGFLELLQRRYQDRLDDDATEFIGFAVDGARRMKQLINDLLAYSRIGTQERTTNSISCGGALSVALRNLEMAVSENGAQVTHGHLPRVAADTTQLTQLFQNLIGNAIKYRGPDPPRIHIEAVAADDELVFSVKDNGLGIEPQYHDRIFNVFERLHTRDEYPGTGIGLAICKKILDYHGGRIWLESEPGNGSTFFFSLPAYLADDADQPTASG